MSFKKNVLWLISPPKYRTSLNRQSVTNLLITYMLMLLTCILGIFLAPYFIVPALFIGLAVLTVGYCITRFLNYKFGGIYLICIIFIIAVLVVFIFDPEGYLGLIAYCWISISILVSIMFLDVKQVLFLIAFENVFTVIIYRISSNLSLETFISWLFYNSFFCIINISLQFILVYFRKELIKHNEILEELVDERTEQLQRNLEEKDFLIRELYHRTNNNMQTIISLLSIQFSANDDPRTELCVRKTSSRINAMALVHGKLYTSRDLRFISLKEYISELVDFLYYSSPEYRKLFIIQTDIQDFKIPLEISVPLGLIVNEIVSNTFKHAQRKDKTVELRIFSSIINNETLKIIIQDDGPGLIGENSSADTRKTGLKIVSALVVNQLKGEMSQQTKNGYSTEIIIPLEEIDLNSPYTHSRF